MKKIYLYLPLILFFIIGCEKEEIFELQKESIKISTVTHEEALRVIDKISPGKGKNNGKLTILNDQIYFDSIINSQEKLTIIPVIFPIEGINRKILILKINGKIDYVLFSMIPDNPVESQKDFNGRIIINELNGKFVNGFRVENGYIISQLIINAALNKCDSDLGFEGIEGNGCFQDLDEVIITTSREATKVDSYTLQVAFIYPHSGGGDDFNSYYYDFQGDPGGGGSGENTTTPPTQDEEVVEITVELKDKELCAYNQLQWAGVNPTNGYINMMTQLFMEFGEGNIGNADLVIREGDLGYRGGGSQRGDEDGEYHIILSRLGNSSSIEIAKTLIHEMAHAFLAKRYDLHNKSFKELYGMYMNEQGLANYSHNIMEDHFINRMAQVLYDYDSTLFSSMDDYRLFSSKGVYEFNEDQLADYNLLVEYARIYDERCRDGN